VPILLGKDEKGRYIVVDMMGDNLPHVLIGGSSGSGKSTQLRSVLTTLITSKKPIELYLADMKRAEFHLFRRCECVKGYVTRRNELVVMIKALWAECERRSDLLEVHEVFNIDQLPKEHRVPYIVLCIDEFGVLRKDKKVQDVITDIALLGRALGVFMILSLQRPDADAVDGDIKTNLNIRMAFRVNSKIDSNIILSSTDVDASKITQGGLMWASVGNQYTQIQAPYLEIDPAKELIQPYTVAKPIDVVPTNVIDMEPEQQTVELGLLDTLDKNGGNRK
jgi:S-DNA-T family DNA segregation ATPase FtsK/SpoIIIE